MFKGLHLNSKYSYKNRHDTGDNPKKTGHPDRDELDRNEAYEMVDFINFVLKGTTWTPALTDASIPTVGSKIERLVKENVPTNIHSRVKIREWVYSNWKSY